MSDRVTGQRIGASKESDEDAVAVLRLYMSDEDAAALARRIDTADEDAKHAIDFPTLKQRILQHQP
jgi:hypothetical protein